MTTIKAIYTAKIRRGCKCVSSRQFWKLVIYYLVDDDDDSWCLSGTFRTKGYIVL